MSRGRPLLQAFAALFVLAGSAAHAATVIQLSGTSFVVKVPATESGWQSTGIIICADAEWSVLAQGLSSCCAPGSGDSTVSGMAWHGPGGGLAPLPLGDGMLVSGAPQFSLVAQVGTTPLYVGEGGMLQGAYGTGALSFAFNDNFYDDNDGFYVVYLTYLSGSCAPTAVGPEGPVGTALGAGRPNPTTSQVEFRFDTSERATYSVSVLDVAGRRVRAIHTGVFDAGSHDVRWDGSDDSGRRVPAGTYFCVVRGAGSEIARKVVMIH